MTCIVHIESEICDQVDIIRSTVDEEINGCRFVNILLVNIHWNVHWKPPGGWYLDHACNEYVMTSIDKMLWLIYSVISNARCVTFILVDTSIIKSECAMNFVGWVMRIVILGEWVEVLLISSKLLSGLKMSASKILCSMKIGQLSISIPSMLTFDFCEEMKSSRWYYCGRWCLSQSWRIFEMQKCATISLLYLIGDASTSHIIWYCLFKTAKVYPRNSCTHRCTMGIHL